MRDHTSLLAWQVSRLVASATYRIGVRHWSPPAAAVFNQVQRSALSVPLNIAEGYALGPGARWKYHLRVAYGSAVETTDALSFMLEVGAAPAPTLEAILADSRRTQALILALLHSQRS